MKNLIFACAILFGSISVVAARPPQELRFPPLKFSPPAVVRRTLSNGATLYMLPDHELPLVNLTAFVRTGSMYDPPGKTGLAGFSASLLRSGGTQSRAAEEIDETLEFLGASLESGMDVENASLSLSVLKKDLDQGLALFSDILIHPRFDAQKLEIEKAKAIEGIRRRNEDPYQIARREFRKLVYGDAHPLSRTLEIPAIRGLKREDLVEFYAKYYCPNHTMMAVSGDFEVEDLVQKMEGALREWKPKTVQFPPVPAVSIEKMESSSARAVGFAEKDVNQTSIIIGHLGIKRHNPDHFALEVMNEILGGSAFSSRLYKEVRSRLGLAYWVGSGFSEPWDYGTIAAGCQTKNQTTGQAIDAILKKMEVIRNEKVEPEELHAAKEAIVNSFVFRYATSQSIVAQMMSLDYFGFPSDYLDTYTSKISAVTVDDVLAAARKYIHPEKFTIMVVGNEKDFDIPLSRFGAVMKRDIRIPE